MSTPPPFNNNNTPPRRSGNNHNSSSPAPANFDFIDYFNMIQQQISAHVNRRQQVAPTQAQAASPLIAPRNSTTTTSHRQLSRQEQQHQHQQTYLNQLYMRYPMNNNNNNDDDDDDDDDEDDEEADIHIVLDRSNDDDDDEEEDDDEMMFTSNNNNIRRSDDDPFLATIRNALNAGSSSSSGGGNDDDDDSSSSDSDSDSDNESGNRLNIRVYSSNGLETTDVEYFIETDKEESSSGEDSDESDSEQMNEHHDHQTGSTGGRGLNHLFTTQNNQAEMDLQTSQMLQQRWRTFLNGLRMQVGAFDDPGALKRPCLSSSFRSKTTAERVSRCQYRSSKKSMEELFHDNFFGDVQCLRRAAATVHPTINTLFHQERSNTARKLLSAMLEQVELKLLELFHMNTGSQNNSNRNAKLLSPSSSLLRRSAGNHQEFNGSTPQSVFSEFTSRNDRVYARLSEVDSECAKLFKFVRSECCLSLLVSTTQSSIEALLKRLRSEMNRVDQRLKRLSESVPPSSSELNGDLLAICQMLKQNMSRYLMLGSDLSLSMKFAKQMP